VAKEAFIARNDLFTVAERPAAGARHDHHLTAGKNWRQ
jgi:hypothetical protein